MWIVNIWRYLVFASWLTTGDPAVLQRYTEMVASGSPCYHYMVGWGNDDPAIVPVCWYDPKSN